MSNKTNLGRVVGLSAFEEWKTKNPSGTWDEFMESLKGPGVSKFEFKEELENGDRIYDVILEGNIKNSTIAIGPGKSSYETWLGQGNSGTEGEFINSLGILNQKVAYDVEGNTILKFELSNNRYTDPILIKRGVQGVAGGTVGEPQPPSSVPYGTIVQWGGNALPDGWLFTNGAVVDKNLYPQLADVFPRVTEPSLPEYSINRDTKKTLLENNEGYRKI